MTLILGITVFDTKSLVTIMASLAYQRLEQSLKDEVINDLYEYQHHKCYICNRLIDLSQPVDVDHIRALDLGGIDSKNNWGLTHQSCNRSKSNRDLDLQRYLTGFQQAKEGHLSSGQGDETFTLGVALSRSKGSSNPTIARIERDEHGSEHLVTSWTSDGKSVQHRFHLTIDPNNRNIKSFVTLIPIEYAYHDSEINPRSIVDLEGFIEEFYRENPQLLPSLAHLSFDNEGSGKILIFDGQHKAAAQLFLGHRVLYVRVFVNPDLKLLRRTNFGAHTRLAQIHFPSVIEDKVGYDIFHHAFESYLNRHESHVGLTEESFFKTLGKEDRDEMKKHFKGYLKFRVLESMGSGTGVFFDYVEKVTSRSKTKPLSYETVRRAFFDTFLYLHEANVQVDTAIAMRDVERDNLVKLLQIFTAKALTGQFDLTKGIYKLEERLATDETIKNPHLRAYRLCRQAPLIILMRQLREALTQFLLIRNRYDDPTWAKGAPLWGNMETSDWQAVEAMFDLMLSHKVWIERNPEHVRNLQDTRQSSWEDILIRGKLPGAAKPVYDPINHPALLKHATGI